MSANTEHLDHLSSLTRAKGFLGREFLTWLWYTAENSNERVKVKDATGKEWELDLWVDDRIVLDGSSGHAHQTVMKGGAPSHSREAAMSLGSGKTVREMRFGLNVKGYGEFSAILNCEDLNPRSLKLPAPGGTEGEKVAQPLATRIKSMELFLNVLDELFLRYLSRRVDPDWETKELAAMRGWIKKRQTKDGSGVLH